MAGHKKSRILASVRVKALVKKEEQERIRASLEMKYIPPMPKEGKGNTRGSSYNPEKGAELCIMRRAGMSRRKICAECHMGDATINQWFSQEWGAAYSDYILDVAEELVPRAEALMEGLKIDGKKLSPKQETRYLRAFERLSIETHWAATHRVPTLYGDKEGGNQFVLIQPIETPRRVTQDPVRAKEWQKEIEHAETGMPDAATTDGTGSDVPGETGGGRPLGGGNAKNNPRALDGRHHKRSSRPMVKRR